MAMRIAGWLHGLAPAVSAASAAFIALAAFAGGAHAAEFKSVGAAPAVMFDAPTERGRKMFIAPRGMPVEVILSYGDWVKVRDVAGDLSWVEARALDARRVLIVNVASAKVHAAPDAASAVVFSADRGVLLELAEPIASGWIRVRHRDGASGYVRAADVWGD
jgi:SH3-like domain-containing protein